MLKTVKMFNKMAADLESNNESLDSESNALISNVKDPLEAKKLKLYYDELMENARKGILPKFKEVLKKTTIKK